MTTLFDQSPALRFEIRAVRGDAIAADFTIEGYAALASHTWRAQVRRLTGGLMTTMTVTLSLVTVNTTNDSVRVEMTLTPEQTMALRPGIYRIEAEDLDLDRTWATGTLRLARDWSHT